MPIRFFSEDRVVKLAKPRKTATWIKSVISSESFNPGQINYIFCSDDYLLAINVHYLNHNTYTDIVTFDNREAPESIDADIYISIDRVRENAKRLGRPFLEELHRVMIHGILHLAGYQDKSARQKTAMREKEDACLSLPGVPRETFK